MEWWKDIMRSWPRYIFKSKICVSKQLVPFTKSHCGSPKLTKWICEEVFPKYVQRDGETFLSSKMHPLPATLSPPSSRSSSSSPSSSWWQGVGSTGERALAARRTSSEWAWRDARCACHHHKERYQHIQHSRHCNPHPYHLNDHRGMQGSVYIITVIVKDSVTIIMFSDVLPSTDPPQPHLHILAERTQVFTFLQSLKE